LLHIGCLFASPKAFEVGTFHPLASSSPVAGIPFSSCLFLTHASGAPRSAEVGGKAAKNSISYMKTEAAFVLTVCEGWRNPQAALKAGTPSGDSTLDKVN
jgi:hypothetical protein